MKLARFAILSSLCFTFSVVCVGCDEDEALKAKQVLVDRYNEAVLNHDTKLADFYQSKINEADAAIASVKTDKVSSTVEDLTNSGATAWIPEPVRTPLLLGAGLFVSFWRMLKWKNAAKSIAKSIEKLPDTINNWNSPEVNNTLNSYQTPMAKSAVDLATGKASEVPLIDRIL